MQLTNMVTIIKAVSTLLIAYFNCLRQEDKGKRGRGGNKKIVSSEVSFAIPTRPLD
jgi:hypothetical protein